MVRYFNNAKETNKYTRKQHKSHSVKLVYQRNVTCPYVYKKTEENTDPHRDTCTDTERGGWRGGRGQTGNGQTDRVARVVFGIFPGGMIDILHYIITGLY